MYVVLGQSKKKQSDPRALESPVSGSLVRHSSRDDVARNVGHMLYGAVDQRGNIYPTAMSPRGSLYPQIPSSTSISMVTSDSISLSDSYVSTNNTAAPCCAPMSPSRRTFCLVLLFDLILTFILWVIYSQTITKTLMEAFQIEVVQYTFYNSLFDTVMCSAWRFVPLLLAYALFRISNPWPIALTTLGTCVYLLCKVFLFDFNDHKDKMFIFVLLIVSFIIAWIETWFLDFKVLPREQRDRERAQFIRHFNEHTPLLGPSGQPNRQGHDLYYSPHESDEDDADFKSLPGSRGQSRGHSRSNSADLNMTKQEQDYLNCAKEAWLRGFEIHRCEVGWKMEAGKGQVDGIVYSHTFAGLPKVYRLTGLVHCSPLALYTELVLRVAATPQWSQTSLGIEVLQVINDKCDIVHHISAKAAGGLVSERDFVSARYYEKQEECYASSSVSVTHPQASPNRQHVRGENKLGLFVFLPVEDEVDQCLLVMYVSTDLKGWIPQTLIDKAMGTVLLDYLSDVRAHVADINKQKRHKKHHHHHHRQHSGE